MISRVSIQLACVAFCHLVAQALTPLLVATKNDDAMPQQICELGCGWAGLASIATLLSSKWNKFNVQRIRRREVLTGNDPEALELPKNNREINGLDPESYGHQLLSWGIFPDEAEEILEVIHQCPCSTHQVWTWCMRPMTFTAFPWSPGDRSVVAETKRSLAVSHFPQFCLSQRGGWIPKFSEPAVLPFQEPFCFTSWTIML